jgi:hypothetical protein
MAYKLPNTKEDIEWLAEHNRELRKLRDDLRNDNEDFNKPFGPWQIVGIILGVAAGCLLIAHLWVWLIELNCPCR